MKRTKIFYQTTNDHVEIKDIQNVLNRKEVANFSKLVLAEYEENVHYYGYNVKEGVMCIDLSWDTSNVCIYPGRVFTRAEFGDFIKLLKLAGSRLHAIIKAATTADTKVIEI